MRYVDIYIYIYRDRFIYTYRYIFTFFNTCNIYRQNSYNFSSHVCSFVYHEIYV